MDRNREARRVPLAAAGNGLSRRRHRAGGSFRDSPEEDVPVELPEAARLRDRSKKERDRERDRDRERERERDNRERDRLHNRSKRRRGGEQQQQQRLVMVRGNNLDEGGDDESSEESVNDDEEYEDGPPPSSLKMLPPSSNNNISPSSFHSNHHHQNHHHHHQHSSHQRKNFPPPKVFRSPPSPAPTVTPSWKAADEMIGVAVPRKARSACTKRPHESWASSTTTGGGVFASSGEQIHRQASSPASNLASPSPPPAPTSPSSSNVSARKKMPSGSKQKPLPPKSSSSGMKISSSSPVAVQDEIEIEIAEVLYGMMRMPLATSKQESAGGEEGAKSTVDVKSRVSSPISNSQTVLQSSTITLAANSSSSNVSAIAPRRKKPRIIKYDDENSSSLPSRAVKSETEAPPSKSQAPLVDQLKRSGSGEENSSVLDSSTNPPPRESHAASDSKLAEKKENNPPKEETVSPKVETSPGFRSDGDGAKTSSPEKEKKFEIDLMAPPPVRSTSERGGEMECVAAEADPKVTKVETEAKPLLKEDGGNATIIGSEEKKRPRAVAEAESHKSERSCELKLDLEKPDQVGVVNKHHVQKQTPPQQQQQISVPDKTAQATPMPLHMSMPGWPGGLPTMGYMPPTQGVVPTDTTSSLSSAAMQPPSHLLFNQPRPKRCATHCYIARNIQSHQQFTKMNPFWPAAAGSAPLYGSKACNLSLMPPTELQGTVLGKSSNPVPDKNPQSTTTSSDTAQRSQILLQQALPLGAANNMMHGPTFIIPVGQQPHGPAASVRPPNSSNTASSGATATANTMNGPASATPAGAPTMTFSYPGMPGSETQYLAILQNNGYPFSVPAHVGAQPAYRGAPGQPMPFFNGSFYSSQMIQPPFSQPQKQQSQQQQAGQVPQSHSPSNQNGSVSTSSSAAQKHLQNQQLRPPINHGNSQGFPAHKVQSQPLSFQQRHQPRENTPQHSETVGEDSPSTADSRSSRSSVAYGQNYGMQLQPTNLGLMSSTAPGGGVVVSSSKHGEKKSQQQGSKAGMESFQSQGYAMTFATFNGASTAPTLNMSSIPQNHPMFHTNPEAARQGYQMMAANVAAAQAAQQKMNYGAPSDDGKSGSNATANTMEEQRKTGGGAAGKTSGVNGGQSIAFSNKHDLADASVPSGSIVDTSRLLNLGSALPQSSSSIPASHQQQLMQQQQQLMQQQQQQHMQRSQSQQPYPTMYLQKQQRYATSVAASAARTKGSVANNGSGFPDHSITVSPGGAAKFPNANSGFPQNLVQSSSNQVQSTQWKNNSPRTTNTSQAQSPSILSPSSSAAAASSLRNVSHKQQSSRPQQSQISFAANSKPMASGSPMQQMQGGANNRAPSPPMLVGSPSTSSVSKNAGGSPRTPASASSAVNKAGQASSTTHSSSQPSKNLQSASVASSTGGRNNGPSVLGNPTTSSGSKSQQQQQQQQLSKHGLQQPAQLFFSNPYMQSQHQQQQITISPSGGYYIQRHQQQPGSTAAAGATCSPVTLSGCTTGAVTVTSDPAKAIAAAAAASNVKGGGGGMGKTQQHQLGPPGFTYVHAVPSAVQVKPADQKQQAGE